MLCVRRNGTVSGFSNVVPWILSVGMMQEGGPGSFENLVEEAIEVDVESTTVAFFEQNVLAMTVAKAKAFVSNEALRELSLM